MNRGNTDMTAEMGKSMLPVVYLNVNDEYINPLHGYTTEMEGNFLRGSITPLSANRELKFRANLYDAVIGGVAFEVRSLDMKRLIEDTVISDFSRDGDMLNATAHLKDLIDDDTEYMVIIKLTTSSGEIIRYYARVINRAELYIGEKIQFVRDFSAKTMNVEAAAELKKYMESNSDGDNSSYAYVNIHSNFKQLTWGNLNPSVITAKTLELLEIDEKDASIMLSYQVEALSKVHNVKEFYRIRRGKDRMYLMDYERTMNQVFDEENGPYVNGKLLHGILNKNLTVMENSNASIYGFVQQNAFFSFNASSGTLAKLFAFADSNNNDERTRYQSHNIKPLSIDDEGNIRFIVYGYMNRGVHEGEVGVAMYYYDCNLNTVEEEFFIPYTKSYEVLKADIDSLSYVSSRNRFYILLDGTVYSINLETHVSEVLQQSISESSFVSCRDQSTIAWQPFSTAESENKTIMLQNLDRLEPVAITADQGDIIVPLGFMNRDLIYGAAHLMDITTDDTGRSLIPMYSLRIVDKNGNVLKNYSVPGVYIQDIEVIDNMIVMDRIVPDVESGRYVATTQDQIMDNESDTMLKNRLGSVVTEGTETTYQTVIYKAPENLKIKITTPKQVLYEGDKNIDLNNPDELTRYYVYAKGSLKGIYTDVRDAVETASSQYGVVVDGRCAYIWDCGNRKSKTRIESIEQTDPMGEDASAYSMCLDAMLKSDGVYKDTRSLLREMSMINAMKSNLEANVLDLTGCDLQDVLYYVSCGYPVMALTGGAGAYVICGYDSANTILYNPVDGTVAKMGMEDSKLLFAGNGNQYITYVK